MDTTVTLSITDVWQAHQRMSKLLDNLPICTRNIIERVLDEGVTHEIVRLADEAPEEEWQRYQALRMITGSNPGHPEYVTALVLDEIRLGLEDGDLP